MEQKRQKKPTTKAGAKATDDESKLRRRGPEVRMTEAEYRLVKRAAELAGQDPTDFIRRAAVLSARRLMMELEPSSAGVSIARKRPG